MTYTSVFTGSVINPADVSYLPVTLTADITLEWPLESNAPTYPAAGVVDVTSIVGAYAITLPNATQGSTGAAILFNGLSTNTQSVTIKNNAGTTVATLASGTQWLLVLAGISTAAGVWRAFQLGATTSAATAASLAGYGIVASSGLLSQAAAVTTFSASPRTVLTTDRASLMVWTGTGSATFNLPTAATAGNNFFVMARNSGGGDMTIDPNGSETINGSTTVALHPGDSAFLVTDGLKWYSVGLGRDAAFAFDFTSISLASAAATYTLSGAELNRVAYKFTGLLTNDVAVVVPATVQQYWVENATTGSFAVTLKTSGGTPVSVTQGGRDIYYCNGTNVVRATTGGLAVPIGVTDGGTGLASFAVGDLVYASAATTLSKLADVAVGNVLRAGGVGAAPAYGKVVLTTDVTGTLPVGNGGTGTTTSTGTGSAVLSVSPTFTGTASFAAAAFSGNITIGGTMGVTGKVTTAASVIGGAGFNLPHGTAPTVPSDGDFWTTTAGVYARVNGTTVGPIGASQADQIDVYTASGTWTKPSWATDVEVHIISGGGGGGSGRKGAAGTVRCGGGAGAGGGYTLLTMRAADLSATVSVVVGAAGTAGAAQATNSTNGNNGVAGGSSTFGTYGSADGGLYGFGGTAASGSGGATSFSSMFTGGPGGSSNSTGGAPGAQPPYSFQDSSAGVNAVFNSLRGGGGGGAGGGIDAANSANSGQTSAIVYWEASNAYAAGSAPGVAGTTRTPRNSGDPRPGSGGGGGGAGSGGAGGAGGAGQFPGGGGGGGGASVDAVGNSGAGGAGGAGVVIVISRP